jgi:hypothetical protein
MRMSCWYASAQMLVTWRRNKTQSTESGIYDPSEDSSVEAMKAKDKGVTDGQIIELAKKLGLVLIPPMSPTSETLESWLKSYGPLWVNGRSHITVIAGINGNSVQVYNPAPVNVGRIEWLDLNTWYTGDSSSSRDTQTDAGVFMHCP